MSDKIKDILNYYNINTGLEKTAEQTDLIKKADSVCTRLSAEIARLDLEPSLNKEESSILKLLK